MDLEWSRMCLGNKERKDGGWGTARADESVGLRNARVRYRRDTRGKGI